MVYRLSRGQYTRLTAYSVAGAIAAFALLPPRHESELDPITLHNSAVLSIDSDTPAAFEKLNFLAYCGPKETARNLILAFLKFEYWDAAADLMASVQEIEDDTDTVNGCQYHL